MASSTTQKTLIPTATPTGIPTATPTTLSPTPKLEISAPPTTNTTSAVAEASTEQCSQEKIEALKKAIAINSQFAETASLCAQLFSDDLKATAFTVALADKDLNLYQPKEGSLAMFLVKGFGLLKNKVLATVLKQHKESLDWNIQNDDGENLAMLVGKTIYDTWSTEEEGTTKMDNPLHAVFYDAYLSGKIDPDLEDNEGFTAFDHLDELP